MLASKLVVVHSLCFFSSLCCERSRLGTVRQCYRCTAAECFALCSARLTWCHATRNVCVDKTVLRRRGVHPGSGSGSGSGRLGTVTWEKARGHGSSTSTPRIRGNTPHTWQTSRAGAGAHQGGGCSGNSWLSSFVRRRARAGRGAPARRFSPVATRGRIRLRGRVSRRPGASEIERERPTATATPPAVEAAGVCRVAFLPILLVVVVSLCFSSG